MKYIDEGFLDISEGAGEVIYREFDGIHGAGGGITPDWDI